MRWKQIGLTYDKYINLFIVYLKHNQIDRFKETVIIKTWNNLFHNSALGLFPNQESKVVVLWDFDMTLMAVVELR